MLKELRVLVGVVLIFAVATAYLQSFILFFTENVHFNGKDSSLGTFISALILTILTILVFILFKINMRDVIYIPGK